MFAAPLMVLALRAPLAGVAEASEGLDVFAPNSGDLPGVGSRGFLVDLVARYDMSLAATGASPELTGPGAPANTAPLPGSSAAGANADHFPRLVVLLSSSRVGAGPGQNLANLFNIVAVTNQTSSETVGLDHRRPERLRQRGAAHAHPPLRRRRGWGGAERGLRSRPRSSSSRAVPAS